MNSTIKACFQVVPELEPSYPCTLAETMYVQGVVQPVFIDGLKLFLAGTRVLKEGTQAGTPTWENDLFQYLEAAAYAASALAEAKSEELLRENLVARLHNEKEAEFEDCVF